MALLAKIKAVPVPFGGKTESKIRARRLEDADAIIAHGNQHAVLALADAGVSRFSGGPSSSIAHFALRIRFTDLQHAILSGSGWNVLKVLDNGDAMAFKGAGVEPDGIWTGREAECFGDTSMRIALLYADDLLDVLDVFERSPSHATCGLARR
jgi:hypothetical protein